MFLSYQINHIFNIPGKDCLSEDTESFIHSLYLEKIVFLRILNHSHL